MVLNKKTAVKISKSEELNLLISLFIILILGLIILIFSFKSSVQKKRGELFPLQPTDNFKAYFEMKAAGDKKILAQNEEIEVDIYLTTTGENLDAAGAIVEWDNTKLDFVKSEAQNLIIDKNYEQSYDSFTSSSNPNISRRIFVQYLPHLTTPPSDYYIRLPQREAVLFYKLFLKAKVPYPQTTIKFADTRVNPNDLFIHFLGTPSNTNAIDQTRAVDTEIVLVQPSPSPSVSPSSSPSRSPSPSPSRSPSPSPSVSPSISPSPSLSPSPSPSVSPSPSPSRSPSPSPSRSPSPSPSPVGVSCNGCDFINNNFLDFNDLVYLLQNWSSISSNFDKLLYILNNWQSPCY